MAINAFELCDRNTPLNVVNSHKGTNDSSSRMVKSSHDDDSTKRVKSKKKKHSPYLNNEKFQLLSHMTEKKIMNKCNEVYSSYPMACDIYRASSGELRAFKKNKQKAKKSVLTLPNVPAPAPKMCTVSDMNDSEYNTPDEKKEANNQRKRTPALNRKCRIRRRGIGFYDRDAHHFLGCSSSELIHNKTLFDGDGYRCRRKKSCGEDSGDVWSVLRNINKFQFNSRPLTSDEDSSASKRKMKMFSKKYGNSKGTRLIETCRTQEISYVANFEIQSKTSISRGSTSSSADRVTVINKKELPKSILEKAVARSPYNTHPQIPQYPSKPIKNMNSTNDKNMCVTKTRPYKNYKDIRSILKQPNQNINKCNLGKAKEIKSDTTIRGSTDSSNCNRASDAGLSNKDPVQEKIQSPVSDCVEPSAQTVATGESKMLTNCNQPMAGGVQQQKPKPRLVTTMPRGATMPKLPAADIKKRLAQLKFPMVILTKDQLSSTIEVLDYDPPQFDGLNDHIWPFMMEWNKENLKKSAHPKHKSATPVACITSNLRKVNNELSLGKSKKLPDTEHSSWKKAKPIRQFKDKVLKFLYKKPCPSEQIPLEPFDIDKVDACTEIDKNMDENVAEKILVKERNKKVVQRRTSLIPKKVVAFEDQMNSPKRPEDIISESKKPRATVQALDLKIQGGRHPWAKAKWASDFIENVIRKITNGTYYTIDLKKKLTNLDNNGTGRDNLLEKINETEKAGTREVSLQTFTLDLKQKMNPFINSVDFKHAQTPNTQMNIDPKELDSVHVPGFDDALPTLEIKTLSVNKIQVKNCMTNVMVQFDVAVPRAKSYFELGAKSSTSSCTPLSVTESHTMVYKCSTTILNAALPEELCTVIPKLMMRNIFDSATSITTSTEAHAIISELSGCESNDIGGINIQYGPLPVEQHGPSTGFLNFPWETCYKSTNKKIGPQMYPRYSVNNVCTSPQNVWSRVWVPPYGMHAYLPLYISPIIIKYMNGRFGSLKLIRGKPIRVPTRDVITKIKSSTQFNLLNPIPQIIMSIFVNPMKPLTYDKPTIPTDLSLDRSIQEPFISNCKELVVYKKPEPRWLPAVGEFTSLLQKMWNYCKFNIHLNIPRYMDRSYDECNNIAVNNVISRNQSKEKEVTVTIVNLHINSLCMDSMKEMSVTKSCSNAASPMIKCIEYQENDDKLKIKATKKMVAKIRRPNYSKLYRKCKSTSNITVEKASTPLNTISNMDEFIHALGAAKTLSSIFDGSSEKKILACVRQMETWMKDITPRQAMLILMLTNKKDTPNLVQFRPVILQGIAVNRITRATELDMELEVIERENVKLRQHCAEIPYIPASEANIDSLFEELYWIAKTTASDYQKPFDESSERLLKDLLGKRKKLNPSYLRVMARYVGLGLLKTPRT